MPVVAIHARPEASSGQGETRLPHQRRAVIAVGVAPDPVEL